MSGLVAWQPTAISTLFHIKMCFSELLKTAPVSFLVQVHEKNNPFLLLTEPTVTTHVKPLSERCIQHRHQIRCVCLWHQRKFDRRQTNKQWKLSHQSLSCPITALPDVWLILLSYVAPSGESAEERSHDFGTSENTDKSTSREPRLSSSFHK